MSHDNGSPTAEAQAVSEHLGRKAQDTSDHTDDISDSAKEMSLGEHLNIKVTDNNNEVFFKIKQTTALKKLMDAFCERQGKAPNSVRFLFDGSRVQPTDSPETVSILCALEFSTDDFLDSSKCKMAIPLKFTRSKSAVQCKAKRPE
jgi:hypothetical protein